MPVTTNVKTDKGTLKLGIQKDRVCLVPPPTNNLVKFSGVPPMPDVTGEQNPMIKSDCKIAKLSNGNEIWFRSYKYDGWAGTDYYVQVQLVWANGKKVYIGRTTAREVPKGQTKVNTFETGLLEGFYKGKKVVGLFSSAGGTGPLEENPTFVPGKEYVIDGQVSIEEFADFVNGSIVIPFPGEDSGEESEKNPGGDGEGPDGLEDDPIEAPEDPGISAVDSGLLTLYVPSLNNIHEFGNFLWSDLFSLDTFKKLFADPMEAVIGISVLPISVPHTAGAESITIGQIESGVFAPLASKQFVKKDCGTLKVNPIWNTALDYDPYTKFSIYLPYIGTRDLKTDDIMGKDLNVSYLIDILSGSCTAHIKVGGSVLYQFSGSCAVPIPLSGTSWTNLLTSSIQLAGTGIAAAMTAGASTVVSAAATGMAVAGTAGLVSASKQAIQRTGAVSGAAGMLGVQTPYLIRETPRQSLAKGYNKFVGYPSNITSKLGDLKGYTQVENIHLENLSCTADEAAEIESLLKEGVII